MKTEASKTLYCSLDYNSYKIMNFYPENENFKEVIKYIYLHKWIIDGLECVPIKINNYRQTICISIHFFAGEIFINCNYLYLIIDIKYKKYLNSSPNSKNCKDFMLKYLV